MRFVSQVAWVAAVFTFVIAVFAIANAQIVTVTQQLEPGDSGSQVSALQTFLASDTSVYPEGLVTGYYGSLTTAAVQRYQCKYGIACTGNAASTGYGRVGPATLAQIRLQEGAGGGVTLPPVGYPPVGGDVNAPVLSAPVVSNTSNSATILWSANERATNRIMYGVSWPFLYAAAPSVPSVNSFSTNASVTIPGLLPNKTYYYVLESVDASGNLQWGIDHSFRTNP